METSSAAFILIKVACVLAAVAMVLAYMAKWYTAIVSFAGLLLGLIAAKIMHGQPIAGSICFWAAVTALAVGISLMVPKQVARSRKGLPFICTGALIGALLGIVVGTNAAVILGSALGVLLAALAMGALAVGKQLSYPSRQYWNYVLAKGLPAVVIFSMSMLLILMLSHLLN